MYKRCEAGESLIGTKHELNITFPAIQEILFDTPVVLPTSEPVSPTFSYTVQQSDLPIFSGSVIGANFVAELFASGKNTDTSNTRTICYRVSKNGASLATATNMNIPAGQFWTLGIHNTGLMDISIGDVIDIYLWQITEGTLNWDYKAFFVNVDRIQVDNEDRVLCNITYTMPIASALGFTLGTPLANFGSIYCYTNVPANSMFSTTTTQTFFVQRQHATYKLYRHHYGDADTTVQCTTHATYHPHPRCGGKVTKIEWYPTALEV